jgi:hypothetical protein
MSKAARSEGNRVAMAIKSNKSPFYTADVDLKDDGADVLAAAEAVRKTLGKVQSGFMLISADIKNLIVVVDIPAEKVKDVSAKEWLLASLTGISTVISEGSTDEKASAVIEIDTPFKLKDIVRSAAFSYLRKCGQLEEESEEEEFFGLD